MQCFVSSPRPRHRSVLAVLAACLVLLVSACAAQDEPGSGEDPEDAGAAEEGTEDDQSAQDSDSGVSGSVGVATHPVGQAYHAVGTAVASLVSSHSPVEASVVPSAGPNAWMTDLEEGNIEFGLLSAIDTGWAMEGGPGYSEPVENMRLMAEGAVVHGNGLTVRDDSEFESISDLEGRRIASDYGGNVIAGAIIEAELASVGLGWEDVDSFPVPDIVSGIDALRAGQADAVFGAAVIPALVEAHAAEPMRFLPFGNYQPEDIADGTPDEAQEVLDEIIPGAVLDVQSAGVGMLEEDMVSVAHPVNMVAGAHVDEDVVYAVLEAIWEHREEMHDAHPMAAWTQDVMPTEDPQAPYHDGAVRLYEDVGVWTDAHQEAQDELLSGMS